MRLQIYDNHLIQYHKYATIKQHNFVTVNNKYNIKMYDYEFLSSIGKKKNYPRLFQ